jgi:hypothetical protein
MDKDRSPGANGAHSADHDDGEWVEVMARTIAHLAAQLTMTQLRLRALATELDAAGSVDPAAVRATLGELAGRHAAGYLRENLGRRWARSSRSMS